MTSREAETAAKTRTELEAAIEDTTAPEARKAEARKFLDGLPDSKLDQEFVIAESVAALRRILN